MNTKSNRKSKATARRQFLKQGSVFTGAFVGANTGILQSNAQAAPQTWSQPGAGFSNYGQPLQGREFPIRWISEDRSAPGNGVSWCPLHELAGTITPNGLHFERHHNGVPAVDASSWQLLVDGLVGKPLLFTRDSLLRYPLHSRTVFIECGGNSNSMWHPNPVQAAAGYVHGLVSCSEWTGVSLALLLNEAGIASDARWLVADALDAAGVTVSLPIEKIMEDSFIALYQNGEPLRAENGYPARLIIPGWEGITHVKWLRSLRLTSKPIMSKFDTVSYTDLKTDGIADRFSFPMGVKSLITSPSAGHKLTEAGFVELRGLAWSGHGAIESVDVSTDGGTRWQQASLQTPVLDKSFTRFRLPWEWNGQSRVIMSRARDSAGNVQATRAALLSSKGTNHYHHYNGIVSWEVGSDGRVTNVYL